LRTKTPCFAVTPVKNISDSHQADGNPQPDGVARSVHAIDKLSRLGADAIVVFETPQAK
jgi:hypothetical protein